MENIHEHEKALVDYCFERFDSVFGKDVSIMNGQDRQRAAIFSFTLGSVHAHDVAQILDESYIAVRAGHHCAMPLHTKLCVPASARASFYIYNDKNDVDALIEGLKNVKKIFG
jgi:cysteine desulfurase/selenocysteine lyase